MAEGPERGGLPVSISGRPVVGDNGSTLCHRGIFDVDGDLPALEYQPTITYAPLRGPIWSASDGIYTTIFLEGREGVICFDTFSTPGAAIAYRKAVGRVLPGRAIHTIVYSHDHLDHTGYALDLAPGAEVIAHRDCADVVELRRSDGQKRATERWSGEQVEYDIDGVRFWLLNPGATHGNGNAAAWFPEQRLLFMVDTVIPGVGYAFLPDWHVASYVANMRRLEALDFDLFVPGHFWPLDRRGFSENLDFFEFVTAAGEEALREGVDPDSYPEIEAYARERHLAGEGRRFRFQEYFAMNLMRAMQHALHGPWGLEDADLPEPEPDLAPVPVRLPPSAGPRAPGGIGRPARPGPAGLATPGIQVNAVAPGLWSATDGHARTVFARGESGVVAVNTLGSREAAAALSKAIEETTPGGEVEALVLSLDHADHTGFAAELAPRAEVVAHALCAKARAARADASATGARIVHGRGEEIELAGVKMRLSYPGPTLGCGNLACHFPEHGALFVVGPRGDARYGLFGDWHLANWAASTRALLELPFETVVPGAGHLTDRARLDRSRSSRGCGGRRKKRSRKASRSGTSGRWRSTRQMSCGVASATSAASSSTSESGRSGWSTTI
jgi:glyoxylase-like metal-dependent hydrolase (beta-lactamase superfamily II)